MLRHEVLLSMWVLHESFLSKKRPFYHIVVADSRSPRNGRCIEQIGHFNPIAKNRDELKVNKERLQYWVSQGAQPSDRVAGLIKHALKAA